MPSGISIEHLDLWFRVEHPAFDPKRVYRAIMLTHYSESAWSWLTFVLEGGQVYTVTNKRCLCVNVANRGLTRLATESELSKKLTAPKGGDSYLSDLEG